MTTQRLSRNHILVMCLVMAVACATPLLVLVLAMQLGLDPNSFHGAAFRMTPVHMTLFLLIALVSCAIPWGASRWVHGRPLDLPWRADALTRGLLLGATLAAITKGIDLHGYANLTLLTSIPGEVGAVEWLVSYLLFLAGIVVTTSVREELIFRAYPLELLGTPTHTRLAMWVSAGLFAVTHMVLEPPTLAGFLFRLAFGLFAALVYLRDGFWGAVGLHAGWNLVAGSFTANWRMGGLWTVAGEPPVWSAYISTTVLLVAIALWRWRCDGRRVDTTS